MRCAGALHSRRRTVTRSQCEPGHTRKKWRTGTAVRFQEITPTMTYTRSSKKQSPMISATQVQTKASAHEAKKYGKSRKVSNAAAIVPFHATTPEKTAVAIAAAVKPKTGKPKTKLQTVQNLVQLDTNETVSGGRRKSQRLSREKVSSPVEIFIAIHNQQQAAELCGKKENAAIKTPSSKPARPSSAIAKKSGYHGSKKHSK